MNGLLAVLLEFVDIVMLSVVRPFCMALYVIVKHKTTSWFEAKMARQLFNVAKTYRCLSNGGHSVRFLNRFGKFSQLSNRISEKFSLIWCFVNRFSSHISAYHLGPCRFMANKNFLWKRSNENLNSRSYFKRPLRQWYIFENISNLVLSKGLEGQTLSDLKLLVFRGRFSHNLYGRP